jgi:hypothetical protein
MTQSVYTVFSALLGLMLLNAVILGSAHTYRAGWMKGLPIEVRYVTFFAMVLLIALNGNQWMAGSLMFPLLALAAIAIVMVSTKTLPERDRRDLLRDGISLIAVQLSVLLAVFGAFQMHHYWLLEAANHDSLVYYQGVHWALESPLFVGSEAPRARWGLGICGEGASWIGFDCPLYRGGTYTLAAWIQYFSPRITGNALYLLAAYSGTMAWFAIRLLRASIARQNAAVVNVFLALPVALSTGVIGALVNSNLATVMAGTSLVLVVALALRTDLSPTIRYGLMAAWCAVAAHFYAEALFYAGLIIALAFLLELRINIAAFQLRGLISLATLILLIVLLLGNTVVVQAFFSIFYFSEMATGGEWFSWYIHQSVALWTGSFIAGLLMGAKVSLHIVLLSAVATISAVLFLLHSNETRSGASALIGTSALAVFYIEATGYQYGEHKILHLLGPAWAFLVAAAISRLTQGTERTLSNTHMVLVKKISGWSLWVALATVFTAFASSALILIDQLRGPKGIDFGLPSLASYIRPGETVLIDDSAWIGMEKYHKGHYLIFELHNQGATVLMPSIASDPLRGGYFRTSRANTFSTADRVDWLVRSRGSAVGDSAIIPTYGAPTWGNADYRLHSVGRNPVVVAGNGWHDCEPTHCWTSVPFEVETYVPFAGQFNLSIEFDLFAPPETGMITVNTSAGRFLATIEAGTNHMDIPLPEGWSRVVFDGDWSITSPKVLGMSGDSRELFAAIRRLEVIRSPMHEVE